MKRSIVVVALMLSVAASVMAQQPPQGHPGQPQQHGPEHDPLMRHFFPPELVMAHQAAINLSDTQRSALSAAVQQTQSKVVDVQWKLSGEAEKLGKLLDGPTVSETQVLEQVDRILALEREVKRAHMTLMVKIKNTLTPAQQDQLRELRARR